MATKKARAKKKTAKKKTAKKMNGRELHRQIAALNERLKQVRKDENELDKERTDLMRSLPRINLGGYQLRFEIGQNGNPEIHVGCVTITETRLHREVLPFVAANFGYEIKKIPEKELLKKPTPKKKK